MTDYSIVFNALMFYIADNDEYKLCLNKNNGKLNYTLLLGKKDYKGLDGYEVHSMDYPIGICGEYANIDMEFIKKNVGEDVYEKLCEKLDKMKLESDGGVVGGDGGSLNVRLDNNGIRFILPSYYMNTFRNGDGSGIQEIHMTLNQIDDLSLNNAADFIIDLDRIMMNPYAYH